MDARHLPTVVYERPPPAGSAYPHIHPYRRDPSPQKQQQHPAVSPPIKGKRKRASPQQLEVLNEVFASTSFPSTETRQRLARELGMTPRTVQIWFQNKRQASRQRDGHHSRNTKSMAASAANVNSFGRQYSKSLSPANSKLSHSPSPGAVHYGSSTVGTRMPPHQLQQYTMAPVSAGATARPGPSEYSSAPSPAPSAMTTMAAPAWREPKFKLPRIPEPAMYNSAEYAHTRNDQWFAEETPARLDYLYSHNSPMTMVPPSRGRCELPAISVIPAAPQPPLKDTRLPPKDMRLPPKDTRPPSASFSSSRRPLSLCQMATPSSPPPMTQGSQSVPVHRSMSLMDLLNAPPEQRRLPPLPPIAP